MGNLGSVANMIKKLGNSYIITSQLEKIREAKKIILPGVGSFDKALSNLIDLGLLDLVKEKAIIEKIPILGICLGMQIMCKSSEEGKKEGLGLIDAEVKRFKFEKDSKLKIPHMGWNIISPQNEHILLKDLPNQSRFYFVHSYYVKCNKQEDILTTTNYGDDFVSSFAKHNIMGVQFHPEKSHKFGMKLLKNFIENF